MITWGKRTEEPENIYVGETIDKLTALVEFRMQAAALAANLQANEKPVSEETGEYYEKRAR